MKNPFPSDLKHIAVVGTAGPEKPEVVKKNCKLLESLGIKVTLMPHIHGKPREKYLCSTVEERVADLHNAWRNESVDLIFCLRGGYGTMQMLPHIDWDLLRSRKIPVLGYSDVTVLHMAMLAKGVETPIAAPMFNVFHELSEDKFTTKSLLRVLSGPESPEKVVTPKKSPRVLKHGTAEGTMITANLYLLHCLLGTEYLPDLKDKILLLEDVGEENYTLDRAFTHLELAGVLRNCAGLILGNFKDCGSQIGQLIVFERIAELVPGPVLLGFPFGHDLPMYCVNASTQVKITKKGEIYI